MEPEPLASPGLPVPEVNVSYDDGASSGFIERLRLFSEIPGRLEEIVAVHQDGRVFISTACEAADGGGFSGIALPGLPSVLEMIQEWAQVRGDAYGGTVLLRIHAELERYYRRHTV